MSRVKFVDYTPQEKCHDGGEVPQLHIPPHHVAIEVDLSNPSSFNVESNDSIPSGCSHTTEKLLPAKDKRPFFKERIAGFLCVYIHIMSLPAIADSPTLLVMQPQPLLFSW